MAKEGEWIRREIAYWVDRIELYNETLPRLATAQLFKDISVEFERCDARIAELENELDITREELKDKKFEGRHG